MEEELDLDCVVIDGGECLFGIILILEIGI